MAHLDFQVFFAERFCKVAEAVGDSLGTFTEHTDEAGDLTPVTYNRGKRGCFGISSPGVS